MLRNYAHAQAFDARLSFGKSSGERLGILGYNWHCSEDKAEAGTFVKLFTLASDLVTIIILSYYLL